MRILAEVVFTRFRTHIIRVPVRHPIKCLRPRASQNFLCVRICVCICVFWLPLAVNDSCEGNPFVVSCMAVRLIRLEPHSSLVPTLVINNKTKKCSKNVPVHLCAFTNNHAFPQCVRHAQAWIPTRKSERKSHVQLHSHDVLCESLCVYRICMHVCVYMYVCMYVCIYIYIHTEMHT